MSTFYHIEPLNEPTPFHNINRRERQSANQEQKKKNKKKPKEKLPAPESDDSSEHNIDEFV